MTIGSGIAVAAMWLAVVGIAAVAPDYTLGTLFGAAFVTLYTVA